MSQIKNFALVSVISSLFYPIFCQEDLTSTNFVNHFSNCKINTTEFDECIRDALNEVRIYFKSGVQGLEIPPFDPFHANEVVQRRGGSGMSYRLTLKDVSESGWTDSMVTKFRSDLKKRTIRYTQFFPEKFLKGEYEFDGNLMASNLSNKGYWNMTLYNYVQTTTISRPPGSKNLKVYIDVQVIGDMDLHISNLLQGRAFMEGMLDRMINTAWRPGFRIIRPLINDLVSTAFTQIFNKSFKDYDFSKILPSLNNNLV